jgi:trehalose 6-phosphate phosphatase
VAALIATHSAATNTAAGQIDAALYGGDDRTDLDAFEALRTFAERGELQTAVCIAVASDESPPAISRAADLTVPGPDGFVPVLEALAE